MSDERIAIRAVLSAEDHASPILRSLIRDVERLKKSYSGLLGLKPIKIVNDGDAAKINATATAVERLADAERRLQATARKAAGNAAAGLYGPQGATFVRSMRDSGVAAAKAVQKASTAQQTASRIEEAALARRLFGIRLQSRLMADQTRQQDRAAAAADRAARAGIRQFGRSSARIAERVESFAGSAAITGAIGAAAAAKLARSGIAGRMEADTAETKARIFGGLSVEQVRDMRSKWLDQAAIANGLKPAEAINAATEALKAGISPDNLRGVTESILRAGVGIELDVAETTRLAGKIATLKGSSDPKLIDSILNSIAVAGKETAANPNEIVSAIRRGAGALGASKMTPQELAAITATNISVGMQEGKAGTFMDYLVNELVGGRNLRGQRRMDFSQSTAKLGLGSLENVSRRAANDPTKLLVDMLDRMSRLRGEDRAKIARAVGGREWQGELLQLFQGRGTLKSTLAAVRDPKNANFLSDAQREKMSSMAGKLAQLKTIASLAWESVGVGLSDAFDRIVTFFTKIGSPDRFAAISTAVRNVVDSFVSGLGFENVTNLLESALGGGKDRLGEIGRTVGEFFRGLGEGARAFWSTVKPILAAFGGVDARSIGKLAAEIIGFSLALQIARPVVFLLGALAAGVRGLAGLATFGLALSRGATIAGALGTAATFGGPLGWTILAGGALAVAVMNFDAIKNILTPWSKEQLGSNPTTREIGEVEAKIQDERGRKNPLAPGGWNSLKYLLRMFNPMSSANAAEASPYRRTALSSSVADMAQGFRSVGAEIEKANFRAAQSAGLIPTSSGGGLAIGPRNIPDVSGGPGAKAVDSFGLGRRGIISGEQAARSIAPRGTGSAERGSSAGPGASNPVERFTDGKSFAGKGSSVMTRLQRDFDLTRTQAAAIVGNLGHESKGLQAINEEKPMIPGSRGGFGWAQWTGKRRRAFEAWVAKNGLDPRSDEANYGFLKHELTGSHAYAIKNLKKYNDPYAGMVQFEKDYEGAGIKGYPSRWKWTQRALALPAGAVPAAPGTGIDAKALADMQTSDQQGWGKWNAGDLADTIPKPRAGAGGGVGGGGMGGSNGGSPVTINIQGHNRDPEALANQVQKRIDEQMKWRTHDVEFSL